MKSNMESVEGFTPRKLTIVFETKEEFDAFADLLACDVSVPNAVAKAFGSNRVDNRECQVIRDMLLQIRESFYSKGN